MTAIAPISGANPAAVVSESRQKPARSWPSWLFVAFGARQGLVPARPKPRLPKSMSNTFKEQRPGERTLRSSQPKRLPIASMYLFCSVLSRRNRLACFLCQAAFAPLSALRCRRVSLDSCRRLSQRPSGAVGCRIWAKSSYHHGECENGDIPQWTDRGGQEHAGCGACSFAAGRLYRGRRAFLPRQAVVRILTLHLPIDRPIDPYGYRERTARRHCLPAALHRMGVLPAQTSRA